MSAYCVNGKKELYAPSHPSVPCGKAHGFSRLISIDVGLSAFMYATCRRRIAIIPCAASRAGRHAQPRCRWRRRDGHKPSGFDALALIGTEGEYDQTSGRSEEAPYHAQLFHLGDKDDNKPWLLRHFGSFTTNGDLRDPLQPDNAPVKAIPLTPLRVD